MCYDMIMKKTTVTDDYDYKRILHCLLNVGEEMLGCGAEVNRVEDTLKRMGEAYGAVKMNVFVITSSMVVTIELPDGEEITQSRRVSNAAGTNFRMLEELNALSRSCCIKPLPVDILEKRIEDIRTRVPKLYRHFVGSVLIAGAFTVFFGGTILDGGIAAVFALLICFLKIRVKALCRNRMVFHLLSSFVTGIGVCLCARIIPGLHIDKVMIGDIMLLIPGLAMTNAIRDMLVGDTISGIMRFIECLLWAAALAAGFMISIRLIGGI